MEGPDGSPPQSLCMIRAAELFPKPQMEKEDSQLAVNFQELPGESVKYLGRTDDGILALTNYRIFLLKNSVNSETSVPLGLIESAQTRDLFHLIINCKDASTVKCSFETAEQCSEWQRRLQLSIGVPETLESMFAFPFYSWTCDGVSNGGSSAAAAVSAQHGDGIAIDNFPVAPECSERLQRVLRYEDDFRREIDRLGFDLNGSWRVSNANEDFKLCASYPQKILVPCCISDEMLHTVANFRGSRRLPVVVWRHRKSGAVIARCSQPEVGWLGWRNSKDEQLLKALADACAFDRGEQLRQHALLTGTQISTQSSESAPSSPDSSHEEVALDEVRKILIVDARSYTSAVTNRARGGGCECIEYYPCAEIEFMNLGNIHVIRKSFHALRQLCASPPDVPNWLGLLEKTMWLQHLSGLLAATMTVCHAIEKQGRPVLVHCSDGWDRTPQIVATAELCLDPYYRTVEGFRVLVEREWLSFGHKFSDRCGHGPGSDELNERCPVFLQWLDLVHQIHKQFPCSFEFSMGYLIKLAQHSLSCLFGTFLCNTYKERLENSVFERTFSVWPFLSGPMYRNPLYMANREKVLWPAHNVRDLSLWTEVYLGSLGNQNCIEFPACNIDGLHGSLGGPMAKTRSYGDLISAGIMQNGISRRSSDPNMTLEPNLIIGSNSENTSVADIQSEREESPDIANQIHDTTRKLQDLTIQLNNHDAADNFQNILPRKCIGTSASVSVSESDAEHETETESEHEPETKPKTKSETENCNLHVANENNEVTLRPQPQPPNDDTRSATATATFFSSPQYINDFNKQIGCEIQETSCSTPLTTVACATYATPAISQQTHDAHVTQHATAANALLQNDFKRFPKDAACGNVATTLDARYDFEQLIRGGVIINKNIDQLNFDLMQSVELGGDTTSNSDGAVAYDACIGVTDNVESQQQAQENLWHGSVNRSTDTLVPIETKMQTNSTITNGDEQYASTSCNHDLTDAVSKQTTSAELTNAPKSAIEATNIMTQCSILPKIHGGSTTNTNNNGMHNIILSNSSSNASVSSNSNSSSLNNLHKIDDTGRRFAATANNTNTDMNAMEESILILPEHQKLEISISGKCETVTNSVAAAAATTNSKTTSIYSYAPTAACTINATQRRRRTLSSNSRRDALLTKQVNGSSMSRYTIATGARSLPMTPPGLNERNSQIAISCPDGLAHALSEQNIRLQQIVYEHKLREDMLMREIHDMRMALLKKICPNCNNATAATTTTNDEQCSALDNVENASICSWEAVEDRSGPSSCASSSIQPATATSSVLWVPDHAVSRCTSCQTEFWIGKRKHHCRSCGQIFCADCSEFWAALPDEKLYSPVRLCGPCYHTVTTRMQQQVSQLQSNAALLQLQQQETVTVTTNAAATSKA